MEADGQEVNEDFADSSNLQSFENEDSKSPADIEFNCIVTDIAFHPTKEVIAAGTIDGDIKVHSYSEDGMNHELMTLEYHKKACRALSFSSDGDLLFSTSKDKSIKVMDMNTGALKHKMIKVHESPIYSMLPIDEYLIATGDDDGCFKVWDFRRQMAIMESKQCEEYISDLVMDSQHRIVVATSGEGTLTAFNIRARRMELQSELFESEFLSAAVVKNGSKVLVGTEEGAINIFNWGEWGNISDRFPGHPESVNAMTVLRDDIVCTGSNDGVIRAMHVFPNRFLGVIGCHNKFPVENLTLSHDKKYLASCSHDQKIKFWNISCLENVQEDPNKKGKKRKYKSLASSKQDDFFAGLTD